MLQTDGPPAGTTWFCVRRNGRPKRKGWMAGGSLADLTVRVGALPGDLVEVCVANGLRPVPLNRFSRVFREEVRGLVGMEVAFGDRVARFSPTQLLAANRRFERALEKFLDSHSISYDSFAAHGSLRAFFAQQFLLPGAEELEPTEMFRGSTLIAPEPTAGENRAVELANGISRWMIRNLSAEGGLPYKYWPSRGVESPADNAIRRFLASLSLARLGKLRGSAAISKAAVRNLRFNLARYFRNIGGGRGAIVETTGAKLGAAAVAALAILESSAWTEFHSELTMLTTGINSLADEDVGFRTFFFPQERDGENWNFYSGEALLFWAEAARHGLECAPSLERCAAAFERCRVKHLQSRNPAFVPWHTQACASLFAQTGQRAFADFVFETNDWLLTMQQWNGLPPDLRGRFYDPRRPEFGPPHAASTGAYLEGLADALALARVTGKQDRATAYERAVNRGLRSLRQLQFRGPCDHFYISRKNRVMGALRTEVYDNSVRVDSAAHALLAAIKITRPVEFGEPCAAPA